MLMLRPIIIIGNDPDSPHRNNVITKEIFGNNMTRLVQQVNYSSKTDDKLWPGLDKLQ